ncbi:PCD23 protein, partial [Stercorarius parasiticus]|nr:PCD23 protein [Stercorarius parasiticus]
HETQSVVVLTVQSQLGNSPVYSSTQVNISVTDINDNPPVFLTQSDRVTISHTQPPGTAVYIAHAEDKDSGLNGAIKYSITGKHIAKDDDVHFEIDSLTGDLFLSKELDYEIASHFLLQVIIKDYNNNPPQNNTVFLSIDVEDQNDHSPYFQDHFVVIGIEENVPVGTLVYTFNAKDGDGSFLNSKIQYSLEMSNMGKNPFLIHPSYGTLTTALPLDREITRSVILTVSATDQAINLTDRRLDSLAAKIVILDINDNSPSFTSSSLSCVMEDVEVGFLVHRIVAKDPDEGRNGQVTYHILSGNENKAFVLDKMTGLLTTAQLLDREIQNGYNLTVMALDDGSPALSATQVLTIVVLDVNDETPIFLKQLYETAVRENQDPGEFVLKVEAVDRDAGLNSLLRYEILPGTGYEKFKMNPDSGELVTTASLDRETQEVFSIKGNSCRDLGSPSRSSTAQLYLMVLDENDHNPMFAKTQYQISVREDLEEGSAILDLFASDKDDGLNGEVMYSLIDDTFGAFAIDSVTGSIVTTKALDRETKSQYTFRVVASDCSTHLPRSSTVMTILIQDVNDNVPKFEQSYYKASVWEGQSPKTDIIQVFATDLDSGLNGETEYSILSGNENATFVIDSARGILATNTVLDHENASSYREMASSHRLILLASDRGTPSLNSTATVLITVLDVNDNPPVFSSPEYHIHVKESIPVGSHVTEVSANDCDAGTNAEITYAIISGNDRGHFHLDGKTGSVDLMKKLDYEDTMKFTLIIQAT